MAASNPMYDPCSEEADRQAGHENEIVRTPQRKSGQGCSNKGTKERQGAKAGLRSNLLGGCASWCPFCWAEAMFAALAGFQPRKQLQHDVVKRCAQVAADGEASSLDGQTSQVWLQTPGHTGWRPCPG